jgi:hypothetical protein
MLINGRQVVSSNSHNPNIISGTIYLALFRATRVRGRNLDGASMDSLHGPDSIQVQTEQDLLQSTLPGIASTVTSFRLLPLKGKS